MIQLPRHGRTRGLVLLAVAAGLLGPACWPAAAQAAPAAQRSAAARPATVYVLQGVAGVTATVVVDGRTVATDAAAKTVVGPLSLPAGRHTVRLQDGTTGLAESSFEVSAGASVDVLAHRFPDADRAPAFTVYRNDLSPVPDGRTRLLLAHAAVVPPADIVVDGSVLVSNVANGESATKTVPAGSYQVSIVPTATDGPAVLGPTTLTVEAGTLTNVFAIGDPVAGTMDAIVQPLRLPTTASGAPAGVNTGDGGQAAGLFDGSTAQPGRMPALLPPPLTAALVAALAVLLLAGCAAATRPATARGTAAPASGPASTAPAGSTSTGPAPAAEARDLADQTAFVPQRLALPSGRTAPVLAAGLRDDGTLAVPDDPAQVGWWDGGARPGDPYGTVVLAGHIDSRRYGIGVLADAATARPGQLVRLVAGSRSRSYRIVSVRRVPKARLATGTDTFTQNGAARLALITCGGAFDTRTHSYADNVVVLAEPIG